MSPALPSRTLSRRTPSRRTVPAVLALLLAAGLAACGDDGDETGAAGAAADAGDGDTPAASAEPGAADGGPAVREQAPDATFVVENRVLLRRDASGEQPILGLAPGAAPQGVPALPESWTPASGSTFRVRTVDLRHVVPSPTGAWVAWETESVHDLMGVVAADGSRMSVLDFYFDSSALELTWAPGGRYVMAFYLPPSGMDQARVYDAEAGARLRTPWGEACLPRDGCRVTEAAWTGGATLSVTTANGDERRHEVDVSGLEPRSPDGE